MSRSSSPSPARTASSPSTWPVRARYSPARHLGIDPEEDDERAQVVGVAYPPPARERLGAAPLSNHRARERHELLADVLVPHRVVGMAQWIADLDHMTGTGLGRRYDAQ